MLTERAYPAPGIVLQMTAVSLAHRLTAQTVPPTVATGEMSHFPNERPNIVADIEPVVGYSAALVDKTSGLSKLNARERDRTVETMVTCADSPVENPAGARQLMQLSLTQKLASHAVS